MKELTDILLDEFEIDMDELLGVNMDHLQEITESYHSTNVTLFYRYMKK